MKIVGAVVIACAGIALCAGDGPKDRIPTSNGEQEFEIVAETLQGIECGVKGGTLVIPWKDVSGKVIYEGGEELEKARRALEQRPADSVALFRTLAEKAALGRTRKVFEQHALRGWAVSLERTGSTEAAAAKYAELVGKYPQSQYLYEAAEKGVEGWLQSGKVEGAKALLGVLQSQTVKDEGRFSATRDYLAAEVEEREAPDKARAVYARVEASARALPDLQMKAKLGVARCLLAENDHAGAERKFREVAEGSEGLLAVRAWNGVGDVNLARASVEMNEVNQARLVQTALLAYLRPVLQGVLKRGDSADDLAKSTAQAGRCFEMYADSLSDSGRRREYRARANDLYRECVSRFGATSVYGKWSKGRLER